MQVQKLCMQVRLKTIMQVQKTISIPFGLRSFLPFSFPTFLPPSVPLFFHSFSPSFNSFALLPSLYSFFLSLRPSFHFSSTIYLLSFLPPPLCRCTPHLLPFFSCLMPSLLLPSLIYSFPAHSFLLHLLVPFSLHVFLYYFFIRPSISPFYPYFSFSLNSFLLLSTHSFFCSFRHYSVTPFINLSLPLLSIVLA